MRIPRRPKQRRNIGRVIRKERRLSRLMLDMSNLLIEKSEKDFYDKVFSESTVTSYSGSARTVDECVKAWEQIEPLAERIKEIQRKINALVLLRQSMPIPQFGRSEWLLRSMYATKLAQSDVFRLKVFA